MAQDADRAEAEANFDAYSEAVLEIYRALAERRIDAELRSLLDAEGSGEQGRRRRRHPPAVAALRHPPGRRQGDRVPDPAGVVLPGHQAPVLRLP